MKTPRGGEEAETLKAKVRSQQTPCRPNPQSGNGPIFLSEVLLDVATPAHLRIILSGPKA